MLKSIMNEKPLLILPTLATQIGFKEALILQYLKECLENDLESTAVEGKIWVRRTYEDWQKNLPFWSVETIKRIISSLEDQGLILGSKIRGSQFDHGKWYTLNDFEITAINKGQFLEEDKYKKILINSEKHPIWIMACENLLKHTDDLTTKKWLCEMDILSLTGSSVHLSVPTQIIKKWVMDNYYSKIVRSLEDALGYSIAKLHLSIEKLNISVESLSPEKEEEGSSPPTYLSSSTPFKDKNFTQIIGTSS